MQGWIHSADRYTGRMNPGMQSCRQLGNVISGGA